MNGPFYQVITKNGSGVELTNESILRSSYADSSPILSFATITEQNAVKHVQIGNLVTYDGKGSDFTLSNYPVYPNVNYIYDHPERDTFCVEQKIALSSSMPSQYGTTYFIEYEKLNVLGFIDDNDSPDYVLKDSLEVSFEGSSSSAAGTISFQLDGNKIRVDTGNFPKVPTRENPVTIKFICKFNFSSDDYEKVIVQDMSGDFNASYSNPQAFGYSFYDDVLVQELFTVTFDSQGGSQVEPYTDVASGSTISRPIDPTKTGYDLSAWCTDTTFETEWDFANDVVTEDMTLYALWKTHKSTVFFNSQGGSSVEPIDEVAYGETITAPTAPTRTGYDFGGWYKEEECITPWDFDNDVVYVDTTLYAKWTIQTFSVTFDSNGGSQVSPYTGVEYGSTINEPSTPEKLEQDFDGWYKDSEFETAWDFANDTVTEDVTLYAKWVEWRKSRIYNPNAYKGENLTLLRGRKVRKEFRPFR